MPLTFPPGSLGPGGLGLGPGGLGFGPGDLSPGAGVLGLGRGPCTSSLWIVKFRVIRVRVRV